MIYDAVIVGGGPAGSVAAGILANAGHSVLLAEQSQPGEFRIGESLLPAARTILKEIQALDHFLADNHAACFGNQSAWGSAELHDQDFIRSPHGHGWHLDRARFNHSLRVLARERGATVQYGTRATSFERTTDTWSVQLHNSYGTSTVGCRWLIDCSGRSRRVVRSLHIPCTHLDRQVAYFTRCQSDHSEDDRNSISLVESVREGWWYTARLPGSERIVVLFTDARVPWSDAVRTRVGFCKLLAETQHISQRLAQHQWQVLEAPRTIDARTSRLERFSGDGWLAVGDAAMSFDPLSSQGIMTALYGGMKAAQFLLEDPGQTLSFDNKYDAALTAVFDRFATNRHQLYQQERRWPDSPFWQNRSSVPTTPAFR